MGIESFGNIEGLSKSVENTASAIEISDSQLSYLKELDVPSDKWESMSSAQQDVVLSRINDRFAEMNIDDKNIMADDYAQIKYILGQKLHAYNSKTDTRKMAIFAIYNKDIFKTIFKDIPNQNEIFIVSMIKLSSNFKN